MLHKYGFRHSDRHVCLTVENKTVLKIMFLSTKWTNMGIQSETTLYFWIQDVKITYNV